MPASIPPRTLLVKNSCQPVPYRLAKVRAGRCRWQKSGRLKRCLPRQTVGQDFPVAVRLGGCDYMPSGSSLADAAAAGKLLERAGIDLLDLSGGLHVYQRPGHNEPGWFADMSEAVKGQVNIPVILTGGVRTPSQAEALLEAGAADLIGVDRAMLRNPNWGAEPYG